MSDEFTKKAVKMLLNGATLISEPCPYCKGVRVMKDGNALCINCGRAPNEIGTKTQKDIDDNSNLKNNSEAQTSQPLEQSAISKSMKQILEKKLVTLSSELDKETDSEKQQNILKSINSILETLQKL